MDSENSRDDSSGNEEGNGPQSPPSSPRSPNRNHSPEISPSPSPQSGPRSPPSSPDSSSQIGDGGAGGDDSRSHSPFDASSPYNRSDSRSRSRPRTPKSPDSALYNDNRPKSPIGSPVSPSCSPSSQNSEPKSPSVNNYGPRSPSPANSSRSSSNRGGGGGGPKSPDSIVDEKHSRKSSSLSPDRLSDSSRKSQKTNKNNRPNDDDDEDDEGNLSDSSEASIDSSSRKNKTISKDIDTQAEEISDGDIESDHEIEETKKEENKNKGTDINISHEDLSDVSDLEESIGGHSEDETELNDKNEKENNINEDKKSENDLKQVSSANIEKTNNRTEEGEEQLDFEAEDGECDIEITKENEKDSGSVIEEGETIDGNDKEPEELEEGEVTDEDDVRPEETEPRPVCRFFSRGQCTWGASCRFLHPGVTDKGNYTMFELIRPVVPGEYGREERPFNVGRPEPAPVESAWERGLRTAKEMLRKSIKRKEQDIDFEEKKMNLSLAQEEFDKENGYYGRVPSPEPRYVRHVPIDYAPAPPRPVHPAEDYYNHRQVIYEPDYVSPPTRERVRSYRELPSHRMPDYYNNKYEEEPAVTTAAKVRKPKREVIVQRAEERTERPVRGDEWSDPWMRSKSPAGRKSSGRKRSYSSGSSYSSSSSSHSSSDSSHSTYRSRSRSSRHKRESRPHRSRHVSPSVIVSERKAANERAALMNPPAPRKRAPSPGMMRVNASNPPAPPSRSVGSSEDQFGRTRSKLAVAAALARVKGRRHSSKSSSESTGSSSSDSDSSGSSSSSSRDGSSPRRSSGVDVSLVKAMDVLKGNNSNTTEKRPIKLTLKTPTATGLGRKTEISDISRKAEALQGKKRPATSPPVIDPKSKKATSRREELLKQLKAVEDAIAKKRSKVN